MINIPFASVIYMNVLSGHSQKEMSTRSLSLHLLEAD